MAAKKPTIEIGLDRPLQSSSALFDDELGRSAFAESAVDALSRVQATSGFVISIEGAWGAGKTSTLAMMEALLKKQSSVPVIVHFNPWLVGDRDALLRHFLHKIATEVKLADSASEAKKVAKQLTSYAKVFDLVKLVPGAEPWASLIKSVVQSAGEAVDSVAEYKTPGLEVQKEKVEKALQRFERPIIVFIDDIDRLFPLEVFEMVRIVKAVGDLPNIGYVLAWDPGYVSAALAAANVPRSETYLDKVVQIRLPLPALGAEARGKLMDKALARLHPLAHEPYFPGTADRLSTLYFSGLREMLEQPRDFARVFNTVALIEPALRGEIVLADIIGLATLMVKATGLYDLIRREPRWFVGRLPGDEILLKKEEEIVAAASDFVEAEVLKTGIPSATRRLLHQLFPLTQGPDDWVANSNVDDSGGYLAAPERLLIATQLHISGNDVSLVGARRFVTHEGDRESISKALRPNNFLSFLEVLGDVIESQGQLSPPQARSLSLDIAKLLDSEVLALKSQNSASLFNVRPEALASRAINATMRNLSAADAAAVSKAVASEMQATAMAASLIGRSYLYTPRERQMLHCSDADKDHVVSQFAKNVLKRASAGTLLTSSNPGRVLSVFAEVAKTDCPAVFATVRADEAMLDSFVQALLGTSSDSVKGLRFTPPDKSSTVQAFCSLPKLKQLARNRLSDPLLTFPARAAWLAIGEGKAVYAVDGSVVSD